MELLWLDRARARVVLSSLSCFCQADFRKFEKKKRKFKENFRAEAIYSFGPFCGSKPCRQDSRQCFEAGRQEAARRLPAARRTPTDRRRWASRAALRRRYRWRACDVGSSLVTVNLGRGRLSRFCSGDITPGCRLAIYGAGTMSRKRAGASLGSLRAVPTKKAVNRFIVCVVLRSRGKDRVVEV